MIDTATNGTKERQQTEISRAAEFVSKIIDNCKDTFQLQCSQRLLTFFKEMYYERHGGKIEKELKKLGAYSFAKKAIELETKTDDYSMAKHKLTTKEVYSIADSAFQDFTNFTLDIKTFLNNVRQIPNYRIPTVKER